MIKEIAAVALGLMLSLSGDGASAQQADCFTAGDARLPSKVTYDNGSTLTVLDRLGGELRSETTLPDGKKTRGSAYRGLFVSMRELPTMTAEYSWNQDLARFFPLKIGDHIVADATVLLPGKKAVGTYFTEMSVVAEEMLRVGSCDYPVLKTEMSSRLDLGDTKGVASGKGFHYYHAASMLTLRSIIPIPATATTPSRIVEWRAIRLE
jgi:hypothetical protein